MNPNIIKVKDEADVVCGSKIVLSPGLRPCRIVLRDLGTQFVTHREYMHIAVVTRSEDDFTYDHVECTHTDYDQGHYFSYRNETKQEQYSKALADFAERAEKL